MCVVLYSQYYVKRSFKILLAHVIDGDHKICQVCCLRLIKNFTALFYV